MRLGVTGATGRMGGAVLDAAADREDVEVVLAVSRSAGDETTVGGVAVESADRVDSLLSEREPNVLVDFTAPDACVSYARASAAAGVAFVSGTTGLDPDQVDELRAAADEVPVLWASNFSRGAAVLERAVRLAADALDDYDAEVVETHHSGKRDAPSGTALDLLSAIDAARDRDHDRVHGREGHAPRESEDVGVHSVRAGNVAGEHVVVLAGNDEQVRLEHRVGDRSAFASGALDAAGELAGRDPGWYGFEAVLDAGGRQGGRDGEEVDG